jgi:hypothetical protein
MDYPYEYVPAEVTAQDQLPLDAAAKKAFFQGIAEQVFGLLPADNPAATSPRTSSRAFGRRP